MAKSVNCKLTQYFVVVIVIIFSPLSLTYAEDTLLPSQLGASARSIALGNMEGFSYDASAVLENPSSLKFVDRFSVSVFETTLLNEVSVKALSMAYRLPKGVLGVGYMAADVDGIPLTSVQTANNNTTYHVDGYYRSLNSIVKLAYQWPLARLLSLGVTGTYSFLNHRTFTGKGYNMDVGALYEYKTYALSISLKNIISRNKVIYSTGGAETFLEEAVVTQRLRVSDWDFFVQLRSQYKLSSTYPQFGIDYHPSWLKWVRVYGGWKQLKINNKRQEIYSMGLGLTLRNVRFDYAYQQSDNVIFDHYNYFSLSLSF